MSRNNIPIPSIALVIGGRTVMKLEQIEDEYVLTDNPQGAPFIWAFDKLDDAQKQFKQYVGDYMPETNR